jgi:hypothetical protein
VEEINNREIKRKMLKLKSEGRNTKKQRRNKGRKK